MAVALGLTMSAKARLGETLEECIARYGQPLEQPAAINPPSPDKAGPAADAVFSVGEFRVHCWFNSVGVCDRIAYWQVTRATADRPSVSHLTRRELVHMLEINLAHDQSWTPLVDFGLPEPAAGSAPRREDYSWWRRTFAPETIDEDPAVSEFSWWRRTFAPQTMPGYVPPQPPPTGIRVPPAAEPPRLADEGPADGAPDHDLAWITAEGSRFGIYYSDSGLFQVMTRDAARRQDLAKEPDEGLKQL